EALAVDRATELRNHLYAAHIKLAHAAWRTGNVQRAVELLTQYETSDDSQTDQRGFEWFYLWRLNQPVGTVLRGHEGEVYAAAFSPDGRTLVTGGQDGFLLVWDVAARMKITAWRAHDDCVNTVSFSRDGRLLVTASCDESIKLWETTAWSHVPVSAWQA